MTSIYIIFILIVFWTILTPIVMFIFPFSGVIGEMLGGEPSKRSRSRFFLGVFVSAIGQTYFYLAYVAFIINWTESRITSDGFSKYIIWIIAFLSAVVPIFVSSARFNIHHRNKNTGFANIIVEATNFTAYLSLIGFFVFIFCHNLITSFWNWVPYVGG
ncbi:MAG: hypothetical protein GZ087_01810 [Flavobacterium sp.]|nr:hypothetical protein [Flavobacterium sp.]